MQISRESRVLLPEDDPIARENKKKNEKSWRPKDSPKILQCLPESRRSSITLFLWFAEKYQNENKHSEHAERRNTEDVLHSEMAVRPRSHERPCRSADV